MRWITLFIAHHFLDILTIRLLIELPLYWKWAGRSTERRFWQSIGQVNQHCDCSPDNVPGAVLRYCHNSLAQSSQDCSIGSWTPVTSPHPHPPHHLEVLKCHPCPQETLPVWSQWQLLCCPNIHPLQMYAAYGATTAAHGRSTALRPLTVCLLLEHKHWGCNPDHDPCYSEAPGKTKDLCLDALFEFFITIPHNAASPADAQAVIIHWLCNFLTDRPQHFMLRSSYTFRVSKMWSASILEPRKNVCSPLHCSHCMCLTACVLYCQRHTPGSDLGQHIIDWPHHHEWKPIQHVLLCHGEAGGRVQGQPPPSQCLQDEGDSGGFQKRSPNSLPLGHQWRESYVGIHEAPELHHQL